jgi:stage II sporulation protein D
MAVAILGTGIVSPAAALGAETVVPVRLESLSRLPILRVAEAEIQTDRHGVLAGRGPWDLKAEGHLVVVTGGPGRPLRLQRLRARPGQGALQVGSQGALRPLTTPITVAARDNHLVVVAQVPEARYVAGVVDGEMTASAPHQALRAQAIVARSFLHQSRQRHQQDDAWVCDQSHCQVWHREAAAPITAAVTATGHLVVTSRSGHPLPVYYHASCGGSTVAVHLVYGGIPQTHLGGVTDAACQADQPWQARLTLPEAAAALRQARLIGADPVTDLRVSDRTASGWPVTLDVAGKTPRRIPAYLGWLAFGQRLGWGRLPGLHFDLQTTGTDVRVNGRGIGHGIGLCQRGTMRQAQAGRQAEAILATYFPGTTVGPR